MNMDMSQMLIDSIPQLQAQINQISLMLQNPSLPKQVRHTTEMQHQQLQAMSVAFASFQQQHQQQQQQQQQYQQQQQQQQQIPQNSGFIPGYQNADYRKTNNHPYANQNLAGADSAYQRLPVNNRRRGMKRERPSDFLEVAGDRDNKTPRYWE
jgi:protein MPE1